MVLAYSNDEFILIKDGKYPGTSSTLEQAFAIAGTGIVLITVSHLYTLGMSFIQLPDDLTYDQFVLQYPELLI